MECINRLYPYQLPSCPTSIFLKAGLAPLSAFFAVLTDKFNNRFTIGVNSDVNGNLVIPSSIVPAGSLNPFSGHYVLRIKDVNHSGLDLTFSGVQYEGVILSFYQSTDPDEYEDFTIQ